MGALLKSDIETQRYTYEDYAKWELAQGERFELIDGVPYAMAAPSVKHQDAVGEIFVQLKNFLRGKSCRVFIAPFDVCLNAKGNKDKNVVQPDILVVCEPKKLADGKRCNGAPDLAIEVLSPSNENHDSFVKFNLYRQAGVREYWVVNPENETVHKYVLQNKKYVAEVYSTQDIVPVNVLNGCEIDLKLVFEVENQEQEQVIT
ncbi:MAG: Uma2 family endonuclease [Oscillospiraceae bacterium]|nr:Uma2 family endonuclease [Oscillospiraceae bacterium]